MRSTRSLFCREANVNRDSVKQKRPKRHRNILRAPPLFCIDDENFSRSIGPAGPEDSPRKSFYNPHWPLHL